MISPPQGRIASYSQNNNSYLYYYLKDQIGSTRVTVLGAPPNATNPYTVNQYYTYHPFGGVNESWGSYATQFKFTGKEHDKHSSFEFDYFGARYYDSRTGLFMTADKGAQFLSAYLYGGNNPIMGTDPDGNLFFLSTPFLLGAAFSGFSYALTAQQVNEFQFLGQALIGGLAGYATAAVGGGVVKGFGDKAAKGALDFGSSVFLSGAISMGSDMLSKTIAGNTDNIGFGSFAMGAASGALGYAAAKQKFNNFVSPQFVEAGNDGWIQGFYVRATRAWASKVEGMYNAVSEYATSLYDLGKNLLAYNNVGTYTFPKEPYPYLTEYAFGSADYQGFYQTYDRASNTLLGVDIASALIPGGQARWANVAVKTQQLTGRTRSLGRVMNLGKRWIGKNPVRLDAGVWRSQNGLHGFRTVNLFKRGYVNFETFDPGNLNVAAKNIHVTVDPF